MWISCPMIIMKVRERFKKVKKNNKKMEIPTFIFRAIQPSHPLSIYCWRISGVTNKCHEFIMYFIKVTS